VTLLSDFEIVLLSSEYEEALKNLLLELDEEDLEQMTKFGAVVSEEVAGEIASAKASMDPRRECTFILLDKTCGKIAGYTSQIYFTGPGEDWCRPGGLFISHAYRGRGLAETLERHNTEVAKQMGRNIQGSMHSDNEGMLRVVRSCGNIIQGLFIDQEKWHGKHVDIVSVANFTDGSVTQEETTRRYLDAATRARNSRRPSPMAAPSSLEIVRLSPDHKERFEDFLLELDKETLRNYTRFGGIIREEVAKKIAIEKANMKPEREQGFIMLDKTGDKIAAYSHLEFFAPKARSHTARSGLVISPTYKGTGVGEIIMEHVVERAKEVGIDKIWASIYWDDKERFELACSLGFIVEAVFVNREKWDGELRSTISMALFVSEPITQEEATERYLEILQDYYKER